jgi:hypothetical protein
MIRGSRVDPVDPADSATDRLVRQLKVFETHPLGGTGSYTALRLSPDRLAKIVNKLMNPPVRRVMSVQYDFALTSEGSDGPHRERHRIIQSDDHLFISRSSSQWNTLGRWR